MNLNNNKIYLVVITKLAKIFNKFNFQKFLINLKIAFICFFILRICAILNFGLTEFFTVFTIKIRILIYLGLFLISFIIVYFKRDFILLLINFLIGMLLGIVSPIIKFFYLHKLIILLVVYPLMLAFWFTRVYPIIFTITNFFLLFLNLKFIWLLFTIIFFTYIYEIILNPFYPLKNNVLEALDFYNSEANKIIETLTVTSSKPFMFGINVDNFLQICRNLDLVAMHDSIVVIRKKSAIAIFLNFIFKWYGINVVLPVFREIYFVNFYYHREFLIAYILVARFHYFNRFFYIDN